jgi:DNA segregation ATPase FtsK/SpoIIIE, S-DNA-T family
MSKKKTIKNSNKKTFKFDLGKINLNKQQKTIFGFFLFLLGILICIAFISYIFTWKEDQSEIGHLSRSSETKNILNIFGASISHFFIYKGFGIASILFAILISLSGITIILNTSIEALKKRWFWGTLIVLWISILLGFFNTSILSGIIGYESNSFIQDYVGKTGTVAFLLFLLLSYFIIRFKITTELIGAFINNNGKHSIDTNKKNEQVLVSDDDGEYDDESIISNFINENTSTEKNEITDIETYNTEDSIEKISISTIKEVSEEIIIESSESGDLSMKVEVMEEEKTLSNNLSDKIVSDFGEFDPTLELSKFKFPIIDLLKDYTGGKGITINQEELENNKNQIVTTLKNYKIEISTIKATVGPTVTLYEIVPEAGVRISKIKNLEDDIALSLAALGIRIIAPMPGKGTVGIEVPNKKPQMVSMRSAIASKNFQEAEMQLPIAFGKTISNETLVVDLAKMPHLLMAGATGQGKSVGLNCILTSLLYKKHPAEVKFVLVDPKKVELTLFNKIERHYLAKLPDSEEAIITDNSKVINTLNSLCIEMDNRYEILKNAYCRNIVEYNKKFKERKLNPNDGHKFLPYIVLVVDEFADLIMTAGKEVETPIARLAQLARAIGIHLIIATQRPSVNVITGMIKANFPARVAFRVMTGIDSKTILDTGGANQLIGRGDMLYTQGNELIRIQCAFVDTPEVEKITEFIGSQKAYPEAYLLPEYVGEDGGTTLDNNISDRDKLFREAAEVLVIAQQGSASLLQRKLKLGYNRAGRLIDQLEAAGIVGSFEGSKARQVLVLDLTALDQLLKNE